jgi:hypothetical protein
MFNDDLLILIEFLQKIQGYKIPNINLCYKDNEIRLEWHTKKTGVLSVIFDLDNRVMYYGAYLLENNKSIKDSITIVGLIDNPKKINKLKKIISLF